MADTPVNPYSPPREQPPQARTQRRQSNRRVRNLLREIAQAFFTIFGIMVGWMLIGYGEIRLTNLSTLLGILVIGLACLRALGIRIRRPGSRGSRK